MDGLVICKYKEDPIKNEGAFVNDNVYTKFGLKLSICSHDMEQKHSDVNQGT